MGLGSRLRVTDREYVNLFVLICAVLSMVLMERSADAANEIDKRPQVSSASTMRLQESVHRLNAWLHMTGQSDRWRGGLMLNILEAQSAKGDQADIGTLHQVYSCFCGGASELQLAPFRDVRIGLQQQLQNLSSSRVGEVSSAVQAARQQFRPITVDDLGVERDLAKHSLIELKGYWQSTMSRGDHDHLFDQLELDEAIAYLDELEFLLAPEVSAGKLNSMIREVNEQLRAVIRKIDALPFEEESAGSNEEVTKEQGNDEEPVQQSGQDVQQTQPDDGEPSRDKLEKKRQELQARVDELKKQRSEILKQDRPRQSKRGKSYNQLREYEEHFAKLSNDFGDPYFVSAMTELERFVRFYFFATSDNLQENYLRRLEMLEAALAGIDGADDRANAGKVGDHLNWLESANQVPHLVTAIRAKYSKPNVYVSIAGGLLNRVASQTANEMKCVREQMDGRLVRGTLYTNVNVAIDLRNDPNQVHASIHLTGGLSSDTYVDQGRIRAFAKATGQLEGRRSIYGNVGGIYAGLPYVAANIQAYFQGTSSRLRLVDRIAAKKFGEVKRKSEGGSARKAEDELLQRFTEQTDEALTKGKESLNEVQTKVIEKTIFLPELYVRSFSSEVMAIGKKTYSTNLGAQSAPVNFSLPADVAVRVHDSMPSNYLDKVFSGKTFSNDELAEEMASLFGAAPDTLSGDSDSGQDEPFSITFATVRPVQIEFEDNLFRVVVSGRGFSQGDTKINEGLKIILQFKIIREDGKLKFVREGEAEIDYLNPELKRPATVAFRSFLIGRLNPKEGGEELRADLPDNLLPLDEVEALKDSEIARQMQLMQCRSENGWLYLGWKLQDPDHFTSMILDVPAIRPADNN